MVGTQPRASLPGPSARGRVPQLLPPPSGPLPPQPRGPNPLGPRWIRPNNPWNSQFGAVCVKPGRRWERAASPRHTPLCTLLGSQAPLRSPLFASGPGSHGAGARLSRLSRAAGRGGGQRGALGQLRAGVGGGRGGPAGPIRDAGPQPQCTSVVGCQNPNKVTSPSADLITLKEVPAPK